MTWLSKQQLAQLEHHMLNRVVDFGEQGELVMDEKMEGKPMDAESTSGAVPDEQCGCGSAQHEHKQAKQKEDQQEGSRSMQGPNLDDPTEASNKSQDEGEVYDV